MNTGLCCSDPRLPFSRRIRPAFGLLLIGIVLELAGCAARPGAQCLEIPLVRRGRSADLGQCQRVLDQSPYRFGQERSAIFSHYMQVLTARKRWREMEKAARSQIAGLRQPGPANEDERAAGSAAGHYYLAVSLRRQGRYAAALSAYRKALNIRPKNPNPHYGIALCFEAQGQPREAIGAYQRYLARASPQSSARWRLQAQDKISALHKRRAGQGAQLARKERPLSEKEPAPAEIADRRTDLLKTPRPEARQAVKQKVEPAAAVAIGPACAKQAHQIKRDPFDLAAYDRFVECARAHRAHHEIIRRMRIAIRDNPEYDKGWLHSAAAHDALGARDLAREHRNKACTAGLKAACAGAR